MTGVVDIVDKYHHGFFSFPLQHMGDGLVKGNGVLVFGEDHHRFAVADPEFIISLLERHKSGDRLAAGFQRQAQLGAGRDSRGGIENIEQIFVIRVYPAAVDGKIPCGEIDLVGGIRPFRVGVSAFGARISADVVVVVIGLVHPPKAAGANFGVVGNITAFFRRLGRFAKPVINPLIAGRQIAADWIVSV